MFTMQVVLIQHNLANKDLTILFHLSTIDQKTNNGKDISNKCKNHPVSVFIRFNVLYFCFHVVD